MQHRHNQAGFPRFPFYLRRAYWQELAKLNIALHASTRRTRCSPCPGFRLSPNLTALYWHHLPKPSYRLSDHPDSLCAACLASRDSNPCVNPNPSISYRLTVRLNMSSKTAVTAPNGPNSKFFLLLFFFSRICRFYSPVLIIQPHGESSCS